MQPNPSVKRKPVKMDQHGIRPISIGKRVFDYDRLRSAIGNIVQNWSSIDDSIITGLERLERPMRLYGLKIEEPFVPVRFADRLKKFRTLVQNHCTDERGLRLLASATGTLQDWTNLRDDLTHGETELYLEEPDTLRVFIIPSIGRKRRPDKAYAIPIECLELDIIRITAGFGGRITGIVSATEQCLADQHRPTASK